VKFDVFGDATTRGYLRNVAGSNDMRLVKVLEHRSFMANVDTALDNLSKAKQISYSDVLQTHKTLFESVYPWAGEDRRKHAPDIAITKGGKDMFAYPRDVQGAMEYGLRQGQDKAHMASRPGDVMGTLAYSHPFLDGNGRTIMTVHAELAHRAGIRVEWEKTNKTDYLNALTRELENPGKGELDAYLKPYVQKATDRQAMAETLKELPRLGPKPQPAPRPAPSTQTAKPEAPAAKSAGRQE
jgi:cell filamentation protein